MTASDTPPPLTEREFADIRARARDPLTAHDEDKARLIDEVARLRAELAEAPSRRDLLVAEEIARQAEENRHKAEAQLDEARRVADCDNVAFQKSVDELTAVNTALTAKLAAVQKIAADWRYEDLSIVRELIEAVGFTTCFAAYGQNSTLCGEALPRYLDWDFGKGDYSLPALTTRRNETTCPKCRAALGETGGTDG